MAIDGRNRSRLGRHGKPRIKYFFLNSDLHRVLSINNGQDLMVAWNYTQEKRVGYVWTDVRKRLGRAYTMSQVSEMIGRTRVQIENYILDGKIPRPQRIYSLNEKRTPGKHFFSEKEVYDLHDYLLTVHIGRPRKDGQITPGLMPSKAELRAMMAHDTIMYVKNGEGEFTPVWKEIDW